MKAFWACAAALALLPSLARGAIVYETAGDEASFLNAAIAGSGLQSFGDEITLGGTARQITSITIPFLVQNFPDVDGGATPYTPNLTLTLYKNDSNTFTSSSDSMDDGDTPVGGYERLGTVLASTTINGPAFGTSTPYNTNVPVTFNFANVLVPNTFSFAIFQNNADSSNGSLDFGIDLSDIGGVQGNGPHPLIIGSHSSDIGANNNNYAGILWSQNMPPPQSNNQFESSTLGSTLGSPAYLGIQATVTAVPEPATLALVVVGVASCLFLRPRRRSPGLI